jgi:5-hydroxyisourate hydrolase
MSISTHILDVSRGVPAEGVAVELERLQGDDWQSVGVFHTDADGRVRDLLPSIEEEQLAATFVQQYRLTFQVTPYFERNGVASFYPLVQIIFTTQDNAHYHVPLLLSPFGYSTYRGS